MTRDIIELEKVCIYYVFDHKYCENTLEFEFKTDAKHIEKILKPMDNAYKNHNIIYYENKIILPKAILKYIKFDKNAFGYMITKFVIEGHQNMKGDVFGYIKVFVNLNRILRLE